MIKRFCDKCGKDITKEESMAATVKAHKSKPDNAEYSNLPDEIIELELCKDCGEELIKKLKNQLSISRACNRF